MDTGLSDSGDPVCVYLQSGKYKFNRTKSDFVELSCLYLSLYWPSYSLSPASSKNLQKSIKNSILN